MKKIILKLCVFYVPILFGIGNATAQTNFNVFTYKEHSGYSKEVKTDVITYTKTDNKKNTYCVIGLYAASNAATTPQQTFTQEWKELVERQFGAKNPQQESATDINGWKTITGTSTFDFNDGKTAVMQFCFVKKNQTASIVALTNSNEYEPNITALLESLNLRNNISTPNKLPEINVTTNKDLLGEWYLSDGNAKITLLFGANGRYDQGALVDRRIVSNLYESTTIKGWGTYTLNGSTLTLIPTSGAKEVCQIRFSADKDDEGKLMRILHLKRPVVGGEMYESDYYFVVQKQQNKSSATTSNPLNSFTLLNGNGITGIWINYGNNSPFLSSSSVGWNWRIFFADGKSLSNIPNGGFANLKSGTYKDESKNDANSFNIGSYKFLNNKGTNTKAGSNYTDKLELVKPNQLKIDDIVFMKCQPVDGQKLSGTFTTYANPNDEDLLAQPKGNRSVINFTADGKFTDEGIYQTLFKDYTKDDAYNEAGKGIYELKDYSIILKFDDGRVKQESFTVPNSASVTSTKLILIGRGLLTKMK